MDELTVEGRGDKCGRVSGRLPVSSGSECSSVHRFPLLTMVVPNGWPLVQACEKGNWKALLGLRVALSKRLSIKGGEDKRSFEERASGDICPINIPWRPPEVEWLNIAFAAVTRFLFGSGASIFPCSEAGDTEALKCAFLLLIGNGLVYVYNKQPSALSRFIRLVCDRVAARRTDSAFKRRLCAHVLGMIAVEAECAIAESQEMMMADLRPLSQTCLGELRKWEREFQEIGMVISFLKWKQQGTLAIIDQVSNFCSYAVPIAIGIAWVYKGRPVAMAMEGLSMKQAFSYVCVLALLMIIVLRKFLFKDDFAEAAKRFRQASWTLAEMGLLLLPQKKEDNEKEFKCSVRQNSSPDS